MNRTSLFLILFVILLVFAIFKETCRKESFQSKKITGDLKIKFPTPVKEIPIMNEEVVTARSSRRLFPAQRSIATTFTESEPQLEVELVNRPALRALQIPDTPLSVDTDLDSLETDWILSPMTPSPDTMQEKIKKDLDTAFDSGFRKGFQKGYHIGLQECYDKTSKHWYKLGIEEGKANC